MEGGFECHQCHAASGIIEAYTAPIAPQYWKQIGCPPCGTHWYLCPLHPTRRWTTGKFNKALEHFTTVRHTELIAVPVGAIASKTANSTISTLSDSAKAPSHTTSNHDTIMESSAPEPTIWSTHDADASTYTSPIQPACNDNGVLTGHKRKLTNLLSTSYFSDAVMPTTSVHYFANEINATGTGIQSIVASAFANVSTTTTPSSADEAKFHLLLLSVLRDVTGPLREKLVMFLHHLQTHPNLFATSRLPTTISDINKIYMKGVNSITSNIPHPQVFCKDDHACVSLRDVIAHQVAHGMDLDSIDLNHIPTSNQPPLGSTIVSSKACKAIAAAVKQQRDVPSNTTLLYVIFWSDDFEVTKVKKRKSVWVHTVTICPPHAHATSARYTHALAVGMKV